MHWTSVTWSSSELSRISEELRVQQAFMRLAGADVRRLQTLVVDAYDQALIDSRVLPAELNEAEQ